MLSFSALHLAKRHCFFMMKTNIHSRLAKRLGKGFTLIELLVFIAIIAILA